MRRLLFVLLVAGLGVLVPALAAGAGPSAPPTTVQKTPVQVSQPGDESAAPTVPEDTNIVGVQWSGDESATFKVEGRTGGGKWYPQGTVTAPDGGADPGSAEARNAEKRIGAQFASEPVQVDDISKVRVKVTSGNVRNVRIVAVGSPPGLATPAPAPGPLEVNPLAAGGLAFAAAGAVSTKRARRGALMLVLIVAMLGAAALIGVPSADAAAPGDVPFPPNPGYVSRAQWGADENLRRSVCPDGPDLAKPKLVVIHHTASPNSYSPAQSASIVRGIYVYYIQGRGYCDIGYNFLVDRYGIIFEGRYGGVDRGIVGAHATNFNTGTTGVAMIGDNSNVSPTAATFNGLVRLLQWKMSVHQINLHYPATHRGVVMNAIIGHRDAGRVSGDGTACPGNAGYTIVSQLIVNLKYKIAWGYPLGNIEIARRTPNAIQVAGWSADPDTSAPINVHAYVDGVGKLGVVANIDRPDVGAVYPWLGSRHGYSMTIPVSQGTHQVCVYGISVRNGGDHQLACRTVNGNTMGSLDGATRRPGSLDLRGWALDPDTTGPVPIHVYVDGKGTAIGTANTPRSDIERLMPAYGDAHGFVMNVPVTGNHTVCAYAISTRGKPNKTLGCVGVSGVPRGALDAVTRPAAGGAVRARGWAFDPDVTGPIQIHVYIDNVGRGSGTANTTRTDVAGVYPGWGDSHGYDITIGGVARGNHRVCTYGISVGGGANALLGCRTVAV